MIIYSISRNIFLVCAFVLSTIAISAVGCGGGGSASNIVPGYTVFYNGNSSTSGSVPDSGVYTEGQTVTVAGNTGSLVKIPYFFDGWNMDPDGTGTNYAMGDSFLMGAADVTLYAKWGSVRQIGYSDSNASTYDYTEGYAICVDTDRNIYVTGYTKGALDDQVLTGNRDLFLVKYNSSGEKQWTRQTGISGKVTWGRAICADSDGNIYVAGYTSGNLDGQSLTGIYDAIVIKYNTEGEKQWTRLTGASTKVTYGRGICVDSDGNSYITGDTTGALDDQTLTGIVSNVFVIKYDTDGTKKWTRMMGVADYYPTSGYSISADPNANIYICGDTRGALDGETNTGWEDLFVIKYNTNGEKQWTRLTGGASGTDTYAYGISVDSAGNSYITGETNGDLDGDGEQVLTGDYDVYTIKYNTSGEKQWTRQLGAADSSSCGYGISVDSDGNSYIAGYTDGNLDGETLTGIDDTFVIKYDTDGVKEWTSLLGVSGSKTLGRGISLDSFGNTYVAGSTLGALDGQTLTGYYDAFVTTALNE